MKDWDGEFGDHRQELVLIGVNMHKDAITSALDQCLLSDEEMADYRKRAKSRRDPSLQCRAAERLITRAAQTGRL